MNILSTILFLLSSAISFGLIYFNLSHVIGQQVISVILLVSVVFLGKFNLGKQKAPLWQTGIAILLSSFLVQTLIISSGGLYSPLLIVIHLYTLGAIFLLNSKSPIFFLLFTLGVLSSQLKYDPILVSAFQNDPWTAVIYGLSFLIIIPLALYLSHNYFIKDAFTKILKNYIQLQEQKESSILTSLNDLVVVTDPTLGILSVNNAVEKFLQMDKQQVLGKRFLDIFSFKDMSGVAGNTSSLSIDAVMQDKSSRYVEGYMLDTVANIKPKPVLLQIRPLTDAKGVITQIVFVMSEPSAKKQQQGHQNTLEAIKRKNNLLETFAHLSPNTPYESVKAKIGLITHIEEDISLAQELEDHQISEKPALVDLVVLADQQLHQSQSLADFLAVKTVFNYYDPEGSEKASLDLQKSNLSDAMTSPSLYSLPLERKFVSILILKMTEIGILIASGTANRAVTLDASWDNDRKVYLKVLLPNPGLKQEELSDLLVLNNPLLSSKTHLIFGSGLEGFILKKLCTYLNIPLNLQIAENNTKIAIEITLDKSARTI